MAGHDPFASVNPFDDLISSAAAPAGAADSRQQSPPAALANAGTTPDILDAFDPLRSPAAPVHMQPQGFGAAGAPFPGRGTAPLTQPPTSSSQTAGGGLLESGSPATVSKFNELLSSCDLLTQRGLVTLDEHAQLTHLLRTARSMGGAGSMLPGGVSVSQLENAIGRAVSSGDTALLATVFFQYRSSDSSNVPATRQQQPQQQQPQQKEDVFTTFDAFGLDDAFAPESSKNAAPNTIKMNASNNGDDGFGDFDVDQAFDLLTRPTAVQTLLTKWTGLITLPPQPLKRQPTFSMATIYPPRTRTVKTRMIRKSGNVVLVGNISLLRVSRASCTLSVLHLRPRDDLRVP